MATGIMYVDVFAGVKMHDFRGDQPIESMAKQSHSSVLVNSSPQNVWGGLL